jgi:hypothetical protein
MDLFTEIDELPPFQRHSETSRGAAVDIRPDANRLRMLVLEALRRAGDAGMTDEEIQDALNMAGSTERPRRGELVGRGFVRDSGIKRAVRSGKPATVWVSV